MDDPRRPGDPPPDETHHNYPDDPYGEHANVPPTDDPSAPVEPSPDHPAPVDPEGSASTVVQQPTIEAEVIPPAEKSLASASGGTRTPPPPTPPADDDDEDEEGMLRMSFMEHLTELRSRLIMCLWGIAGAFVIAITFSKQLWDVIRAPAAAALTSLGLQPNLITTDPTEGISIIWFKLPLVVSLFIAAPWVLYQFWAFIAPGLYKKERRWAAPFIISSALLFVGGGLFAYFVAFRFGLTFLLGIGVGDGVVPMPTVTHYFDLFVNVTLGVAIVFELPVLLFLLTLLRIVSPSFLITHSRYAILAIVILAAVITPTPDVVNLMIFAIPMILLYFLGVFASYLLVLRRENRRFPWKPFFIWLLFVLGTLAVMVWIAMRFYHYHFVKHWPFLVK
ncbi:MAG TPA: twin-arginine translocase subunit TatC [Bryobacteraceae bacterium]|jgi:sec-independent protein translocase protein TatC|nr:twin-arginine translocase subunit TatC [Bryobacteraceae bacterium]